MKKKRIFPIILGLAVMCLVVWLFWSGILRWRQKTKAAEWMEIQLPSHETFVYMDDHGGFHGDGETVMILSFSPKADAKLRRRMEESAVWKKLPMTTNLRRCIYGSEELAITYLSCVRQIKIPEVTNGYWFFLDRQISEEDPARYRDEAVLSRPSINCIAAVYDMDNRILYYWKFDT